MLFYLSSSNLAWRNTPFYLILLVCLLSACKTDSNSSVLQSKRTGINEVVVRLDAQPKKLNPILTGRGAAAQVEGHLFNYLLVFGKEGLSLEPSLAKSKPLIKVIEDGPYKGGRSYTYEIQEAATWDNGTPITASDVLFTLKAINNPLVNAQAFRGYVSFFREVLTYPDKPKKLTILADETYVLGEAASAICVLPEYHYDSLALMKKYDLKDLTNPAMKEQLKEEQNIKDFAEWMNKAETNTKPLKINGSGPYKVNKWLSNQELVLEKKKNWWGEGLADKLENLKAHPDKIIYKFIPEMNTSLTLLNDEGLDVINNIPFLDYDRMRAEERMSGLYDFSSKLTFSYAYIGLNHKHPILGEKKIRRALAHLIDVDEIIETLEGGYAKRTIGPFNSDKKYYHKELSPIPFDLAKAKKILAEAGWKDTDGDGVLDKEIEGKSTPLSLEINHIIGSEVRKNTALLFQASLKKAGIELKVEAMELGALVAKIYSKNYDMSLLTWSQVPGLDDPYPIWHSDSYIVNGGNLIGFESKEADRLIEAIRTNTTEEKLFPFYQQFQELIYEEQPYIFLYNPINKIAIHKRFQAAASTQRPGYFENTFRIKNTK